MRTSTLRASKAHVSPWKFFAALLLAWICVPISQVSAQEKANEKTVLTGVDDITGVDPSETYCTTNATNETDPKKIVYLYNVGAKKFLSIGGKWGTHASLDATPHPIYMIWNSSPQTFFLESKVKGSANRAYLGIGNKDHQVYMDIQGTMRTPRNGQSHARTRLLTCTATCASETSTCTSGMTN